MNETALAPIPPANIVKAEPKEPPRGPRLNMAEKAVIVIVALGPETASRLLSGMGEKRLRRFARIVNDLQEVPAEVVESVLAEFLNKIEDTRSVGGGAVEARRFLSEVMDKDQVNDIMSDLNTTGRSVWSLLGDVDDLRLANWLRSEHPQVAAIALSRLTSVKAAKVLERFEDEERENTILRMGAAASTEPAIAKRIGDVIARDFLPGAMNRRNRKEPADLIAGVMNHVSGNVRDRLLEAITGSSPALADAVKKIMFTFDHIPERINPRDAGLIMKSVDEAVLLRALKIGGEKTRVTADFLFDNISKRLSERLREDLAALPEPTRKEGETAQAEIVSVIIGLRDSGALKMVVQESADE